MKSRYIAKQVKATGKWAVFQREVSKKAGYIDTFVQEVAHGMHTACAIAEQMNRAA